MTIERPANKLIRLDCIGLTDLLDQVELSSGQLDIYTLGNRPQAP